MEIFQKIEVVVGIAVVIIAALSTLVGLVIKFGNDLKIAKEMAKQLQGKVDISDILVLIKDFVIDAEVLFSDNGQREKYVLDKLETFCIYKGVSFDGKYWSQAITTYIEGVNDLISAGKDVVDDIQDIIGKTKK